MKPIGDEETRILTRLTPVFHDATFFLLDRRSRFATRIQIPTVFGRTNVMIQIKLLHGFYFTWSLYTASLKPPGTHLMSFGGKSAVCYSDHSHCQCPQTHIPHAFPAQSKTGKESPPDEFSPTFRSISCQFLAMDDWPKPGLSCRLCNQPCGTIPARNAVKSA